jgi:hypothetical protein
MEEMIEKYLLGLLSEAERKAFEIRIASDPDLAKEVGIQKDLMQAARIQGLKAEINNAYHKVRFGKMLKTALISVLLIAVVGLGIYLLRINKTNQKSSHKIDEVSNLKNDTTGTLDTNQTKPNLIVSIESDALENDLQMESGTQAIKDKHPEIYKIVKENPIDWSTDTLQISSPTIEAPSTKIPTFKVPEVSSKRNNALMKLVSSKYPEVFAQITNEFDLSDSTISTGVCEHLCNLKRATHIRIGNSQKTKDFPLEHSSKIAKRREVKELYKASLASCNCNCY